MGTDWPDRSFVPNRPFSDQNRRRCIISCMPIIGPPGMPPRIIPPIAPPPRTIGRRTAFAISGFASGFAGRRFGGGSNAARRGAPLSTLSAISVGPCCCGGASFTRRTDPGAPTTSTIRSARMPGPRTTGASATGVGSIGCPSQETIQAFIAERSGWKMRAFATLMRRRRTRSLARTVCAKSTVPFTVPTLPSRPPCVMS